MSPVDRADPLTGTNFTLEKMRNFSPNSEMRKRSKTSCGMKFKKLSKHGKTHSYNFHTFHSFGNSCSCITTVEFDTYDVENAAGKPKRCRIHLKNSSR